MIEKYIKIITKLPNPELFPNRKNGRHWGITKNIKNQDKDFAYNKTKEITGSSLIFNTNDELNVVISIIYPDKRRRDIDNILSALKAQLDGIFLALQVDDSQISILIVNRQLKSKINPRCEIEISEIKKTEVL